MGKALRVQMNWIENPIPTLSRPRLVDVPLTFFTLDFIATTGWGASELSEIRIPWLLVDTVFILQ